MVPFRQRAETMEWFRRARFGLFMHYGVYSILGRGEWVQLREAIPVKEYEKLKGQFTADKFDAGRICAMAANAGMKYVNLTARHHDSFCLFKTAEPADKWEKDADFRKYIDFTHAQIRELLTQYGPVEGMWFDPIMGYYARPDLFPIEETYALVRKLQPNCLICFKQGANGDEDFTAPERKKAPHRAGTKEALAAWEKNKDKWGEICDTLQPGMWGYNSKDTGKHLDAAEVARRLKPAQEQGCNLLMNTGPLPDGSIHPEDVKTLAEVGRLLAA
jgi:alpha-L-fucosidase